MNLHSCLCVFIHLCAFAKMCVPYVCVIFVCVCVCVCVCVFSGVCRCCGSELESIQLTAEEYQQLKDRVMTDIIQGRDVFNKTTPEVHTDTHTHTHTHSHTKGFHG